MQLKVQLPIKQKRYKPNTDILKFMLIFSLEIFLKLLADNKIWNQNVIR